MGSSLPWGGTVRAGLCTVSKPTSDPTSDPTSECHLQLCLPGWGARPRVPITQDLRVSTQGVATQGFSFQSVFIKTSRQEVDFRNSHSCFFVPKPLTER